MATIRNEFQVGAPVEKIWDAVRDFGNVHTRVAPGFLTECKVEGEVRIVTFFNGLVARESLVSVDDANRRLVYAMVDGRVAHYNASVQVFAEGAGARVVWIIDLLPNEMAAAVDGMAGQGAAAMKAKLEAAAG